MLGCCHPLESWSRTAGMWNSADSQASDIVTIAIGPIPVNYLLEVTGAAKLIGPIGQQIRVLVIGEFAVEIN